MLSIKHLTAAVALGAALLALPATANAKVIHKASSLHKTHAKTLLHRKHKHVAVHATHVKHTALAHRTTKASHLKTTTGWKHHHAI